MIIFIYGEDSYSALRHLEAMRARFQEKFDPTGMNVSEFVGGKKLEIGPVSQAVQSPGLMSDKRMVIVKGLLEQVTRKPDAKPWVEQLTKTPEETIAIFFETISDKKVVKNEIYKQLSKKKDFHEYVFPTLEGTKLNAWAEQEAKRLSLQIDRSLLQNVCGLVGADLWQLSGELSKLAAYAKGSAATPEMVELLVKANFDDQMFAFIDAVAQKRSEQALKLLAEQRRAGSTDFHLFGMIARQVRLLIGARSVLDRNPSATKADVAKELAVHPFVAQKTLAQARAFESDQLQALHDRLFEFDKRVKTGGANMTVVVDRLVADMVS